MCVLYQQPRFCIPHNASTEDLPRQHPARDTALPPPDRTRTGGAAPARKGRRHHDAYIFRRMRERSQRFPRRSKTRPALPAQENAYPHGEIHQQGGLPEKEKDHRQMSGRQKKLQKRADSGYHRSAARLCSRRYSGKNTIPDRKPLTQGTTGTRGQRYRRPEAPEARGIGTVLSRTGRNRRGRPTAHRQRRSVSAPNRDEP